MAATGANAASNAKESRAKYSSFIEGYLPILGDNAHEGRIAWMYLDSNGHLTIGIGHLIAKKGSDKRTVRESVAAIWSYGFSSLRAAPPIRYGKATNSMTPGPVSVRSEGEFASVWNAGAGVCQETPQSQLVPGVWGYSEPSGTKGASLHPIATVDSLTMQAVEILALGFRYHDAKKHSHTYGSSHYQPYNSYVLTENGIDRLAFDDVLAKIAEIKGESAFRDFDDFPESAQTAIVDIAYQGGAHGAARQSAFANAVKAQQWETAAAHVPFGNVAGPKRTEWRRAQLLAAV